MLLVACAVTARTAFVACSDKSGCMGFYPSDATIDVRASDDAPQGCIGFYPCDADCSPFDAHIEADASEPTDADADADAGDGEPE